MLYRATVSRVAAGELFVEVPRLAEGYEFGPVTAIAAAVDYVAGDRVLVATVEELDDELVILGRVR